MNRNQPHDRRFSLARMSIWTITHHDFLAQQIRTYVWFASATVLFLSIASVVPLEVALYVLLFCGVGMMILLWSLIQWRKTILLDIRDEELRQTAHAAMLTLIHTRQAGRHTVKNRKGPFQRWLNRG